MSTIKGHLLIDLPHTWAEHYTATQATPDAYAIGIEAILSQEMPTWGDRTIIIGPALAGAWGLDERIEDRDERLVPDAGCKRGPVGPWMTYRQGRGAVHVGILPWMLLTIKDHPIMTGISTAPWEAISDRQARMILGRLVEWRNRLGGPYRGIPGIAGIDLLRRQYDNRRDQPLWHYKPPVRAFEEELHSWTAPKGAPVWEGDPAPSMVVDTVRAYLAAAGVVELAPGKLDHTRAIAFDKSKPGWWHIDAAPWQHPEWMPDPLMRGARATTGGIRVSTPTLRLWERLTEEGFAGGFRVLDSWTAPRGHRIFRNWAHALNMTIIERMSACADPQDPFVATLKAAYRQTIGLLNREGGMIYREDWHYAIIATARSNFWWNLWAAGRNSGIWPSRIATDAAQYRTTAPLENLKMAPEGAPPPLGHFVVKASKKTTSR